MFFILRKDIAGMYGITPETLKDITSGRNWKYLKLEPLKSLRGKNSSGTKYSRKRYHLIDTLTKIDIF